MSDNPLQTDVDTTVNDVMSLNSESAVCDFVNLRLQFLNIRFDCQTQEVHIFVFIVLVWIGILLF